MDVSKSIIFSAVQPSGNLTLGNYIGSISHWSAMQSINQCMYSIADLHAVTVIQDANYLRSSILDTLSFYLASGVDPDQSIIFLQSEVYEHCQLNWILSCYTYFGELSRMTQFKTKAKRHNSNINIGLFSYPVLMSSDILLYQSNKVLIGEDQKQHLELARNIAKRFNSLYGNIFTIPEYYIPNQYSSKIMSLSNPTIKMSKSDINHNNVIFLLEEEKSIFKKVYQSITDSENKIYYNINDKPGISNLLNIYSSLTGKNIFSLEDLFHNLSYKSFKHVVAITIIKYLRKLKDRFYYFRNNTLYLENILQSGADKARFQANKTLEIVYSVLGLK
ncbi:Tryptophan--tRNA ligase [Buchnera aphidicola (Pterocallis alni)]|uniref:tryptophan--tRNA ligase n=1 Tax=Buchnera aphidicola TaxID=9 RepID=UPI003464D528